MTDPATTSAQPSTEAVKLADEDGTALERLRAYAAHPCRADLPFGQDLQAIADEFAEALRQSPPLPSGDEVEAIAQMLQDHMEQYHGLFLTASECDAFAVRALSNMRGRG